MGSSPPFLQPFCSPWDGLFSSPPDPKGLLRLWVPVQEGDLGISRSARGRVQGQASRSNPPPSLRGARGSPGGVLSWSSGLAPGQSDSDHKAGQSLSLKEGGVSVEPQGVQNQGRGCRRIWLRRASGNFPTRRPDQTGPPSSSNRPGYCQHLPWSPGAPRGRRARRGRRGCPQCREGMPTAHPEEVLPVAGWGPCQTPEAIKRPHSSFPFSETGLGEGAMGRVRPDGPLRLLPHPRASAGNSFQSQTVQTLEFLLAGKALVSNSAGHRLLWGLQEAVRGTENTASVLLNASQMPTV